MMIRSYEELSRLETFEERYRYLALQGVVGEATFGFDRWVNQQFYHSREWRRVRELVILRDEGCDLGVQGYEIHDRLYIHHMIPMRIEDLRDGDERILDLNYLITCTHPTHNAIHYGDESKLVKPFVERRAGDTKLW
jgi:hypothetical protein